MVGFADKLESKRKRAKHKLEVGCRDRICKWPRGFTHSFALLRKKGIIISVFQIVVGLKEKDRLEKVHEAKSNPIVSVVYGAYLRSQSSLIKITREIIGSDKRPIN